MRHSNFFTKSSVELLITNIFFVADLFSGTLLHFACISSISYSLLSLKLMFLVFQAIALDNAIKTTAFLLKVNCVLATAFMFICILVRKENFEKNISLVFSSALDYKYNKKGVSLETFVFKRLFQNNQFLKGHFNSKMPT